MKFSRLINLTQKEDINMFYENYLNFNIGNNASFNNNFEDNIDKQKSKYQLKNEITEAEKDIKNEKYINKIRNINFCPDLCFFNFSSFFYTGSNCRFISF